MLLLYDFQFINPNINISLRDYLANQVQFCYNLVCRILIFIKEFDS